MSHHARLFLRNGVYYHRAAVPRELWSTFGKREELKSLRTKDKNVAVQRLRMAAVDFDQRIAKHRERLANQVDALTDDQIQAVADIYHAHLLEEDEDERLRGLRDEEHQTIVIRRKPEDMTAASYAEAVNQIFGAEAFRAPTLSGRQSDRALIQDNLRRQYAVGGSSKMFEDEAKELLSWQDIDISLSPDSPSWPKLARALLVASIRAYQVMDQRDRGDPIETPTPRDLAVVTSEAVPTFSIAVESWIEERSRSGWRPKTVTDHRACVSGFMEIVGDKPISDYTRADGRLYKSTLLSLPSNARKNPRLAGLSYAEAAKQARLLGLKPMSESTVNKRIRRVSAFWSWAEKHYDEAPRNPLQGQAIALKKKPRDERRSFRPDELQRIFSAPIYTGCASVASWTTPGDLVPKDAGRFWVPLIGLFSGMRLGEIIQLQAGDVRLVDGFWVFDVNGKSEDASVKTANAERLVPVHPNLIDIGFLDHVERVRAQGGDRVFGDLRRGSDGYYSSPFSKAFTRFLKALGVKDERTCFHSLRHNVSASSGPCAGQLDGALNAHGMSASMSRIGWPATIASSVRVI